MLVHYPFAPAVLLVVTLLATAVCTAAADPDSRPELDDLQKRNASLEELVRQQQAVIAKLFVESPVWGNVYFSRN